MSRVLDVAVVGVTDLVGETLLAVLEERRFPIGKLYPLESGDAVGKRVQFNGKMLRVENLEHFDFSQAQLAWFCSAAVVSALHVPRAAAAGCVVIDGSGQFGAEADVPLVVPEVNPHAIAQYKNRHIIANPSRSNVPMLVALQAIYAAVGIERVNVAAYQSVSEAGTAAIEALAAETVALLNAKPIVPKVYPKQIAFNVLPQVGSLLDNGSTEAEMAMLWETRKVFADDHIQVNASAVYVPMFHGVAQALHIETRDKITAAQARELLAQAAGVEVLDAPQAGGYPTVVTEAANNDAVYVGRIREAIAYPRGLNLWVVADNIRKGGAVNPILIAEILIKDYI